MRWAASFFLFGLVSISLAQSTIKDVDVERRHNSTNASIARYTLRSRNAYKFTLDDVESVRQLVGYLDDTVADKHMFYWFFESRSDPDNDPIILWLNGGPGSSSMLGLFSELGPVWVAQNMRLSRNLFSWNKRASLLFLDQPVGTGFSYGKHVKTTLDASKDIYAFLRLFFQKFPLYAARDLHVAGESYAGHYIPRTAVEILSHPESGIKLRSIIIGNGLVDAYHQTAHLPDMACGNGGFRAAVNAAGCRNMRRSVPACQEAITKCYDSRGQYDCKMASDVCSEVTKPYTRARRNVYDVRLPVCDAGESHLCYPTTERVESYLQRERVRRVMFGGAKETRARARAAGADFAVHNYGIHHDFEATGDAMLPSHEDVATVLDSGNVSALVYAGDLDFIANWLGNRAWTNALDWHGASAFRAATPTNLTVRGHGGVAYGTMQYAQGLGFARIFNASHFVPRDRPEQILDLVTRWIHGKDVES